MQLRFEASVWLEQDDPRILDERNRATAGDENIGVDDRVVIGSTGSAANEFANLSSGVSNWHVESTSSFWVNEGERKGRGCSDLELTHYFIRFS